jgi:hypothetical protein
MRKYALVLFAISFPISSIAIEPIKSFDSLEKEYTSCLMKDAKKLKCTENILNGRMPSSSNQQEPMSVQLEQLFAKWLDKENVFAIHKIKTVTTGEIFERREYIIEDTSGSIMFAEISLIKRLDKWYIYEFNLSSKREKLESALEQK